jgi:hypothetical protein
MKYPYRITWVKRRARRLETFFNVPRRQAVAEAWLDWIDFYGASNV